jgi:hypothetical protein
MKATPRIITRRRDPLTTLLGLLTEASRIYRKMKAGQLDHEKGRSLVWVLAQMRSMVETQHLERIEGKLNELHATAESRGLITNGHDSADPQARLPN